MGATQFTVFNPAPCYDISELLSITSETFKISRTTCAYKIQRERKEKTWNDVETLNGDEASHARTYAHTHKYSESMEVG